MAAEVRRRCASEGEGGMDIARLLRDEALAAGRARAVAHADAVAGRGCVVGGERRGRRHAAAGLGGEG